MGANELIIQIIGYVGGTLSLYAFYMVSSNKATGTSFKYQLYNIIGAVCLVINTAYVGAFPSMGVNIVWIVVAVHTLHRGGTFKSLFNRLRIGGSKNRTV